MPSNHLKPSPATQLIQHLRQSALCVDNDWAIDRNGGFSWWPHHQRQDVFIDRQSSQTKGALLERVVITTEVGTLRREEFATNDLVRTLARLATVSGMVCEETRLRLHSHAWVDKSNQPLYDVVLGLVAGLQIREAWIIATALEEAKLATPAATPHPVSGMRDEPDEIASVVDTLIAPAGRQQPPWPAEMFEHVRENYFAGPPCLLANSAPSGVTAEFPFGTESSLLQANTTQSHPVVGKGLWVMNSFGVDEAKDDLCHNPLALNAWEIEHSNLPFLGSWCAPEEGILNFVTFVPNIMKHPAVATNFILLGAGRARLMAMKWRDDDWSKTWDADGNCRAKTAMERAMSERPES